MIAMDAISWALFAFGCWLIVIVMVLAFFKGAREDRGRRSLNGTLHDH